MNSYHKRQLVTILLVVGIGFLGISLPYPILAPMILNNINSILGKQIPHHKAVVNLGILLSAYPLGQFLGASILGKLSDSFGRKKVLLVAFLGTCIGYAISSIAIPISSYYLLLTSRFFTGFCEGNIAIAQAAAADMAPALPKSTSFSMINAAIAIGFTAGPLLGGLTYWGANNPTEGYFLPFVIASALSLCTLLFIRIYFKETLRSTVSTQTHLYTEIRQHLISSIGYITEVLQNPLSRRTIIIYLLFYIGIDLFYEFYPLFFVGRWNFSPLQIGWFSAVYTLPYTLSQGLLVSKVSKFLHPIPILQIAGIILGIMLIIFILPDEVNFLYLTLPILAISLSFCSTNTVILVSDSSGKKTQGQVIGVSQSLRVLNIAIITLIGGWLGSIDARIPLLLAGLVVFMATILLKWVW